MDFEWDEEKNKANIAKHGISFDEAALIFSGPTVTEIDNRWDYDEIREISIGQLPGQVIVVVAHTERNDITRLISARLAIRSERNRYHDYCKKISQ